MARICNLWHRIFSSLAVTLIILLGGILSASAQEAHPPESGTDKANTVEMVPHKALYKFKLESIDAGTQLTDINGQMFYEIAEDGCDAWTTSNRFSLHYTYADRPAAGMTSDFNTWESRDGGVYHFSYIRKANEQTVSELRGTAHRNEDGTGIATYHTPKNKTESLPKDYFYPVQHTMEAIMAAQEGRKFFSGTVFDGSSEDGPSIANGFVAREVNAIAELPPKPELDIDLLNGKAWKIRLAFFKMSSDEAEPDYEMTAILHENGVISDAVIEYPTFTIHQELVALEKLHGDDSCSDEKQTGANIRNAPENVTK